MLGQLETQAAVRQRWTDDLAPAGARAAGSIAGRLELGSTHVTRDGRPVTPVSGELHYSRVARAEWDQRLRLMRAGGITAVATYVIWIHHQRTHGGEPSFDGNLDLGAFVDLAEAIGLDVVLRVGPWCHGEVRNGGFPDWVQQLAVAHRTNDQDYLRLVAGWFGAVGDHLGSRVRVGGPIVAVQIENELYDQPDHIARLIALAKDAGIQSPIWTSTGWGSAQLPDTVLPLFGGYGDGFWVDADAPWDSTFQSHYFFSHVWDDPGIGADLRTSATSSPPAVRRPAATCELGGGMATAYHRRPVLAARDVAAIGQVKLGNGSVWQGYYMFAGGSNAWQGPDLQESLATGYPNDLPPFDYDFHAPIGACGTRTPAFDLLRDQHTFLAAFGERLAPMSSSIPEVPGSDLDDDTSLRWAWRCDERSGFVFISQHQPNRPVSAAAPTRFAVEAGGATVEFPDAPVMIPAGTQARWPVRLQLERAPRVRWATGTALTTLDGPTTTFVLRSDAGIPTKVQFDEPVVVTRNGQPLTAEGEVWNLEVQDWGLFTARSATEELHILVLEHERALRTWAMEARDGGRLLVTTADDLWVSATGELVARTTVDGALAEAWDPLAASFVRTSQPRPTPRLVRCNASRVQAAPPAPVGYGGSAARPAAPKIEDIRLRGARWEAKLPDWATAEAADGVIEIVWQGDVAALEVGGTVVADRFWDGTPWRVDLRTLRLGEDPTSAITVTIVPLHPDNPIGLSRDAQATRRAVDGDLLSLDSITCEERLTWTVIP